MGVIGRTAVGSSETDDALDYWQDDVRRPEIMNNMYNINKKKSAETQPGA
jgi:hypothetical protein